MTKHPAPLSDGRTNVSTGKPVSRTQFCKHCRNAVGQAGLFVNDPSGPSGWFHIDCYQAARMGHVAVEARLRHADAESVLGIERTMRELIAPRKIVGVRPTRSGPAVEDPQRGGRV